MAAAVAAGEAVAALPTLPGSRTEKVMMMVVMILAWVLGELADTGAATTLTPYLTGVFDYQDKVGN